MHRPSFTDVSAYRATNSVVLAQLDVIKSTAKRFVVETWGERRYGRLGPVQGIDAHS
jgi:hypothetical protein